MQAGGALWLRRSFAALVATTSISAAPAAGLDIHFEEPGPVSTIEEAAPSYPELRIRGFTDLNFLATDDEREEVSSGFRNGQLVLHLNSALSPHVAFMAELAVTATEQDFKTSVERVSVGWHYDDALRLSLGRYHTPVNWWNTAFHHGQWLQTTIDRPEMTRFGGRFIPVHLVGGLAEGVFDAAGLNLKYEAGAGNGRSDSVSGAGDVGDSNNNRAWLIRLSSSPDAVYPLELGAAFYRDKITLSRDDPNLLPTLERDFDENLASAFIVWTKETPEILAEVAWIGHESENGREKWDHAAGYVQAAWRLPWNEQKWKPYFRFELMEIDDSGAIDPAFAPLVDRDRWIAGVRYDFIWTLALKGEWRHERSGRESWTDQAALQVALTF